MFDRQIAPSGVRVLNPAFDVTPAELVTAIITERGVARAPLARTLPRLVQPQPREGRAKAAMSRSGRTAVSRGDRKQRPR